MSMRFPTAAGWPVIALLALWIVAEVQNASFGPFLLALALIFAVAGALWPKLFQGPEKTSF